MEETRELAALMNRTFAYMSCVAAILTGCGAGPSVDSSNAQAAVAQVQENASRPAEKPAPQSKERNKSSERKKANEGPAVSHIVLNAPSYMLPNLSPRYATLSLYCINRKIHVSVNDSEIAPKTNENGDIVIVQQTGEIIPRRQTFWQRNSIFFDEALADFPPMYTTVTKRVPNGNGGIETRTERRLLDPGRPIRDIIMPNLKTAKTMRLEDKFNGGLGPTFDLTTINADVARLEVACTPEALGE